MMITYLWSKLMKKLPLSAVRDTIGEKPSKINAQSTILHSSIGRYSYCGYGCTLVNCEIGRYCSIANGVSVGLSNHPMDWVSTSPAFHLCPGRSIPRDMAVLSYDAAAPHTVIGHDVWIGENVLIKSGVTIGNGAVIGMGSVVTRDIAPYTVVAGNPARVIRQRFVPELAARLDASRWWDMDPAVLKKFSHLMDDPEGFLKSLEAHS